MSPTHPRNPGDPARRAAAQAARAKADAERAAATEAYWTVPGDERPDYLPSTEDCRSLHASALRAYRLAHDDLDHAAEDLSAAEAWDAAGRELAKLALDGNTVAMERLRTQVRAVHPGIVGFLPVPDANDSPGYWSGNMKDLGLVIDVPASAEVVTDEYAAALAEALRGFVRRFEPKFTTDHRRRRVGNQVHAYAETRVGTLLYHPHPKRPAYFRHPERIPGVPDSVLLPDTVYPTLEDALRALPTLLTMGVLAGRTNPYFRTDLG